MMPYRILLLADHAYRDLPGLPIVKAQIEKFSPGTDVLICDIHLFDAISERWHPHVVVIPHLHDKGRNAIVDRIRRRGGLCVVLPTEGRANNDEAMYWAANDFPLELCDLFLCWSDEFASRLPESITRAVMGCQRFDLYFPPYNQLADDRQIVLSKYGLDAARPIVTVASSFPYAKFATSGTDFVVRDFANLGVNKRVPDPVAFVKSEAEAFVRFQAWIRILACEYPEYQIIVKPHPAEDVRDWVKFCGETRVDLMLTDYIFNLLPISTVHVARVDCVTIPEAWIAGVPTVQCLLGDVGVSGAGREAASIGPFAGQIEAFIYCVSGASAQNSVERNEAKRQYISKWLGPMPGSAERIARAVWGLLASKQPQTFKEPDFAGNVEIHSILVKHSAEHEIPKADYIGQFGKAVRFDAVNDWTNKAREILK